MAGNGRIKDDLASGDMASARLELGGGAGNGYTDGGGIRRVRSEGKNFPDESRETGNGFALTICI